MSDRRMLHRWSFAALVQSAIKDNPDYQEEYYEEELISQIGHIAE